MASNINPNNIDGTYPIAGQDNDSQGFRDNFTNIKSNFSYTKAELEDLQGKVVLKAQLSGGAAVNNDLNWGEMSRVVLINTADFVKPHGNISASTVDIRHENGPYQTILATAASIKLNLVASGWPASGKAGRVIVEVKMELDGKIVLPSSVKIGHTTLAGVTQAISGDWEVNVAATGITANDDAYVFEFVTTDGGTTFSVNELSRPRNTIAAGAPVNTGAAGDYQGKIMSDSTYLYVCTANYDGVSQIWKRVALTAY